MESTLSNRRSLGCFRFFRGRASHLREPEIIELPIVEGSRAYLDWIADSVKLGT